MAITEWTALAKEELEKILAEGVAKEIAETHALGLPTTHGDMYGAAHETDYKHVK